MTGHSCDACASPIGFIVRYVDSKGQVKFLHDTCVGTYLMSHHDVALIFAPGPHDKDPKVIDLMQRLQLSLAQEKLRRTELEIEEPEELVFTGPKLVRTITIDE